MFKLAAPFKRCLFTISASRAPFKLAAVFARFVLPRFKPIAVSFAFKLLEMFKSLFFEPLVSLVSAGLGLAGLNVLEFKRAIFG